MSASRPFGHGRTAVGLFEHQKAGLIAFLLCEADLETWNCVAGQKQRTVSAP